jgi:hypothetical protein
MIIIALCLTCFVWGNHQITNPPSCGNETVITFMNVDSGSKALRPCMAGETPVQANISEALAKSFQSIVGSSSDS